MKFEKSGIEELSQHWFWDDAFGQKERMLHALMISTTIQVKQGKVNHLITPSTQL